MSSPVEPAPEPVLESLLERASRPVVLAGWLAQVESELALRPDDARLTRRRAVLLRGLGRLDAAAAAYEALPTQDDRAMADLLRGRVLTPATIEGPARFVRIPGVLDPDQRQALWDHVADEATLEPARVGPIDQASVKRAVRQAATHTDVRALRRWFLERVTALVDQERVMDRLGVPVFTPQYRELQITRHLDGGFYRLHRDIGGVGDLLRGRRLTYVYYFHRCPRRFSGGDLLLCDQGPEGRPAAELGFTRLEPLDNSLVFFASERLHSVTPVAMDSGDPLDGRWTVNGWFHDRPFQPDDQICRP